MANLSDSKMPKDEGLRLLRVEMQRCLGSLKGKRQKISQLHEELRLCRGRVNELQSQVDEAQLSATVSTRPELLSWVVTRLGFRFKQTCMFIGRSKNPAS